MMRKGFSAATLLAALVCFSLFAQSDLSTITGVIKDPSGSAVPGAKVNVHNEATGVERQTVSADSGTFTVTNLPSGFYTVTVEGQGFKKFQTSKNKLDASVPLAVDVSLGPWKPMLVFFVRNRAPMFDVMMMIVFLKSIVLPRPSVR